MEELTTMIINFFSQYGWQLGVCALSGIFILGCIKCTKVFDKIENVQVKKALYLVSSVLLSVIACAIYLKITNGFTWKALGLVGASIFGLNQVAYQLYETSGVRALWKKLLNFMGDSFTKLFGNIKNSVFTSFGSKALRELADKVEVEEHNKEIKAQAKIEAKENAKKEKEAKKLLKEELLLQAEYQVFKAQGGTFSYETWKQSRQNNKK